MRKSRKLIGRVLAVLIAGVLTLGFLPSQPARAAGGTLTLWSAQGVIPITQDSTTVTVKAQPVDMVMLIVAKKEHNGAWMNWDNGMPDANGYWSLKVDTTGNAETLKWRIEAQFADGAGGSYWVRVRDFTISVIPVVQLRSAPSVAGLGQQISADLFTPYGGRGTAFIDVLANGRWSRSSQGVVNLISITLPLTYGANTPGVYTFRAGLTMNGLTGYSAPFTIKRASLALWSAPGVLAVGQTGSATGKVSAPPGGSKYGTLQVLHGGKWVSIKWAALDAQGRFTVPLAYGVTTKDTYTFRLAYQLDAKTMLYTKAWTTTRR